MDDLSNWKALDTGKTFWYVIDFSWKDGDWEYAKMADLPDTVIMKDTQNRVHEIKGLGPDISRQTLGVRQCPTGLNQQNGILTQC